MENKVVNMVIQVDKTIGIDGKLEGGFVCFGDNPAFKFTAEIVREDLIYVFILAYELGKAGDSFEIVRTVNGVPIKSRE